MFFRLLFGIATAPEYFQREMLHILGGTPGYVCHMDDILVFGKDKSDHDTHLHRLLHRLQEVGITLNAEKCEFAKTTVKFLGRVLVAHGISA